MELIPFFRALRDILFIEKNNIEWTNNGQYVIVHSAVRAQKQLFPTYFWYVLNIPLVWQ